MFKDGTDIQGEFFILEGFKPYAAYVWLRLRIQDDKDALDVYREERWEVW